LKKKVSGMISALPTVFTANEKGIDEKALRAIVDFNIESGIHGLMICGGTGEFPNLSFEERKEVFSIVVDQANGRVPVIATTGFPDTKRTIEMTKIAKDVGVDFAMIPKPYGGTIPTEDGLYDHYYSITKAVDIPIICYVAPITSFLDTSLLLWQGKSAVISAEMFQRLADLDNIVAYKDTSCNLFLLQETISLVGEKMSVLAGTDRLTFPSLVVGCDGAIIATACIAPRLCVELYEAVQKNEIEKARQIQYKLLPLCTAIELLPNFPASVKYALELLGYKARRVRKPCRPLTAREKNRVKEAMKVASLPIKE